LTGLPGFCHGFIVRTTSFFICAALVSALGASALGCAGTSASSNASTMAADARETRAEEAMAAAQREDSIEAYESVMKRFADTDAAGYARLEVARLSAELARVAIGRGDWEDARVLASRALELGDPIVAKAARTTMQQIDQADARETSSRVDGALGMDDTIVGCAKAIRIVGATLGDTPSKVLARDLRKASLPKLSSCIQQAIDAAKPNQDFAPVRSALTHDDAKRAFGDDTQFSLLTSLHGVVVAAMQERTKQDIADGKWKEAFATYDSWQKAGKAGPKQVEEVKRKARDRITATLLKRGKAALGKRTAEAVLADLQRAFEVFAGMNVSKDLEVLRDHLTTWVACKNMRCLAVRTPTVMYNFGTTGLRPPRSTTAAAAKNLSNGTRLWVLARSRTFSLVSTEDPGRPASWAERIDKAEGWVDAKALERQDTTTWLPVGAALVGERVWLPTGRDDDLHLLGVVKSVEGAQVKVERISDGQVASVKRDDLRSGVLTPGRKVLAFCRDTINLTEAKIDGLVEGDVRAPRAELICLEEDGSDGRKRREELGALRAKAQWLPPRRP